MAISSLCWTVDCNGIFFNNTISYNLYKLNLTKVIINTFVCGRFHVQGTLLPK